MKHLVFRILKDYRISLLLYILIAFSFVWMFVSLFPSMTDKADELTALIENYPEALMKAFGIKENVQIFYSLETFMSLEHYSLMWPLLLIALTISYSSSALAGEIEKGTVEYLLSLPLSRWKVFMAKYLAGFVMMIVFIVMSIAAVFAIGWMYDVTPQFDSHVTVGVLGMLLGFAVYSMTFLLSAIFSERGKALSVSAGVILVMYALNVVASLQDSVDVLKYFSFFYYYDFNAAVVDLTIEPETMVMFVVLGALCTVAALVRFMKRDIAI